MSKQNQGYTGAYSRRFSNYALGDSGASMFTVQCTSGDPTMGTVRLEVVNNLSSISAENASQTVQNRDGSVSYALGTWLKATAEPFQGYKFVKWETNVGTDGSGARNTNTNPFQFKVTKNTLLTAHFQKIVGNGATQKTVEVRWNGEAGQVTCTSRMEYGTADGEKTGIVNVTAGDTITLKAVAASGYHFVKWAGSPVAGKTTESVSFNVNNNCNLRAVFAKDDNGGGGGGGQGDGENPPKTSNGEGGDTDSSTDLTTQILAFVKKWWWALAIAAFLYYNSKKGGSK